MAVIARLIEPGTSDAAAGESAGASAVESPAPAPAGCLVSHLDSLSEGSLTVLSSAAGSGPGLLVSLTGEVYVRGLRAAHASLSSDRGHVRSERWTGFRAD